MSKLQLELFSDAKAHWAAPHRQVFCQHDDDTVVLFRACCEHLGPHAADTKSFKGSPCYEKDRTRMMWFHTSFLVAMRKSCWGAKRGREVVLAIWVKRSFLEDCLGAAVCSNTFGSSPPGGGGGVGDSGGGGGSASGSIAGGKNGSNSSSNGNRSPGSRYSSPASSVASSPPASPAGEQRRRWQQRQRREAFALGEEEADRRDSSGNDGGGAAASVGTSAAALLAKGKNALVEVDGEESADGRNNNDGGGEELRGRAATGDPSAGAYFGVDPIVGGGGGKDGGRNLFRGESGGVGGWAGGAGAPAGRRRSQSLSSPRYNGRMAEGVRLHWEPERLPSGEKHRTRRVVQLGLKGKWLQMLGSGDAVVRIERLDGLLSEQRAALASSAPQNLMVPVARALDVGHLQDAQLAALHLVSDRARPKLRILCLHGYLQNSQTFSQRTRQLSKKLKNTAELVYVDAPHLLSKDELPPPLPSLSSSPLEEAATRAAAAAAAAAAKVVNTGEGGALGFAVGEDGPTPSPNGSPLPTPPASPTFGQKTPPADPTTSGAVGGKRASAVPPQDRAGARTWWRCDAEERKRAKAVPGMAGRCEWKGVEESLAFLRKVWDEQGPFDGLLGFSQGAAMASIFNHCAFAGGRGGGGGGGGVGGREEQHAGAGGDLDVFAMPLLPPPRFAVFISGCFQPHPTQIPSYPLTQEQPQEELPSLHVWAVEDRFVPASQSQRLAGMYLRASVFMHRGSHFVPQNKDIVPNFIRFLEELR
eukprot:g3989.t1